MKRAYLIAALVFVLVGSIPAAASAREGLKSITFLTNYVFNGRHSPFFVGLEKGFYRDAGRRNGAFEQKRYRL